MNRKHKKILYRASIVLLWLAVWQLAALWVDNDILLAGPAATLCTLLQKIVQPTFWRTVITSFLRIAVGFSAGMFAGLLLAAFSARWRLLEDVLFPVMALIKAVPVASFVVLFLIWWRSNVLASVISFCVVMPNLYVNTLEGLKSADRELLEMAGLYRVPAWNRFFYIYRPALRPFLDSSIRISVGMSWKSGVAAEVIGTPAFSIGEGLYMSKIYLDTAGVLAWTAVVILVSVLFEWGVLRLWALFQRWQPPCRPSKAFGSADTPEGDGSLRLRELTKRYHGKTVLDKVSGVYQRGEIKYFVSPSGSGKTTLFRLIAGLEPPDEGSVEPDDLSLTYVFQEDRLCEDYSALRNVEMVTGDRELARKHLMCLLEPEDLDRPCRELSGGMKRRVAVARAFAVPAQATLLDEPYTGLDEKNRERVKAYIEEYGRERILLIATHI